MLEQLKKDIELKLSSAEAFAGAALPPVELSPAPEHTGADLSLNWAMAAAKVLRKNPLEIAKQAAVLLREVNAIADATAAAPGFINVQLEDKFLTAAALDRRIKSSQLSKHKILPSFHCCNCWYLFK